jgi:PAS domain S-box-containing protein
LLPALKKRLSLPVVIPAFQPQLLLGILIFLLLPTWRSDADPARLLTTAAAVRNLTPAEADSHLPVRLQGVITFCDPSLFSRFLQDSTAGIYLRETNLPSLSAGMHVEVEGVTSSGEYAPVVLPERVRVIGHAPLPDPHPVLFEQLASGKEDSQFVEVGGVVRSVLPDEPSHRFLIDLATGGGRLAVYASELPSSLVTNLIDSTVRIRGVCSSQFNRQRQLFAIRLLVPRADDVKVEALPPGDPFASAPQNIRSLFQFTPQGSYGHRLKFRGTVTYFYPGLALYIEDMNYGLLVQTKSTLPLRLGEQIEVLGFAARGQYTPALQDAIYQRAGLGPLPVPAPVTPDQALKGDYDSRLVRIEARLINHAQTGREQSLTLETRGVVFHAYQQVDNGRDYAELENGSLIALTGICLVEPGDWEAGETWRAKSFRLLLRNSGDVQVLRAPDWWNVQRVLWVTGALGLLCLSASAWVAILRGRVRQQTGVIRDRLQREAALKNRYEDLLENANDMVFTNDLFGRITSLNQTGERLLQRTRQSVVTRNWIEFMPEDQQEPARQWLQQVGKGADLPATEWDFLNAAGQRIKLEISARLLNHAGHQPEIEGIARDITERRQLERELLEISNREQRRIGHDLHDGVCQQLAAINYLTDILGDQLLEKGVPESAEAERIGHLINEVNVQARSVARGLFPVRLEEHGLVLALEDLAATATRRHRITCRFICDVTPVKFNSDAELHLYYIVQEALANAVNHGKSTSVIVTLTCEGERMKLTVQDNGMGFAPTGKGPTGMGIRIMRHRAKVIGAALELESQPGHGTQITCQFSAPVRKPGHIEI